VPILTDAELQALLSKLEAVCEQARELQQQIKAKMAESARGNYTEETRGSGKDRRKTRREPVLF